MPETKIDHGTSYRKGRNDMKKIGIIGAMEIEVETLKSHMQIKNTITKASMTFLEGTLNGVDVIIVRSGIGKVNAGICVQILVDLFEVTHIINTGVAGSLNAAIDIGDIVLSTDTLYHDVDATGFGYPIGEVLQIYSRAAICQVDSLHYLYAHVGHYGGGRKVVNVNTFSKMLYDKGVRHAYNIDGGQTGELIINGKIRNSIDFGSERTVSDMIYFATALPN